MVCRKKVIIYEESHQAVDHTTVSVPQTLYHTFILGKLTVSHSSCFGLIQRDCLYGGEQRSKSQDLKWLDKVSTKA